MHAYFSFVTPFSGSAFTSALTSCNYSRPKVVCTSTQPRPVASRRWKRSVGRIAERVATPTSPPPTDSETCPSLEIALTPPDQTSNVSSSEFNQGNVCSVCARYADLLLRDVPYDELPLNLRLKLHYDKYRGSSWAIIVVADLLADLSVANIIHSITNFLDICYIAIGFFSAYALADLASGMAIWFTFNFLNHGDHGCYCEGTRDFARRMATNCAVVLPFLALLLWLSPGHPLAYSFLVYFLSFVSVIPALVDWSGSSSFPPSVARILRRIGFVLGKRTIGPDPPLADSGPVDLVENLPAGIPVGASSLRFLTRAWNTILAERNFFHHLEKWIYMWSRGRLVPKAWRMDPAARERAFSSMKNLEKLHEFFDVFDK